MENTVRTAIAGLLNDCLMLRRPYIVGVNSTLNQRWGINQDVTINETEIPSIAYAAIGIGGVKYTMGPPPTNLPIIELYQHRPTDSGLFLQLPFVLRLPSEDLTPAERANYRLRRLETHDGTVYVAYYLKKLDLSATLPQLELRKVENNTTTSTTFKHTLDDLSPQPTILSTGNSNTVLDNVAYTVNGDYVAATAKVPFTMDQNDIDEFKNVCNIIYGDERVAVLSEVALCSGVERVLNGDFNGASLPYNEAIAVQVCAFIAVHYAVSFINRNIDVEFDLGTVEPLLTLV